MIFRRPDLRFGRRGGGDGGEEMPLVGEEAVEGEQEVGDAVSQNDVAEVFSADEPGAIEDADDGAERPLGAVHGGEAGGGDPKGEGLIGAHGDGGEVLADEPAHKEGAPKKFFHNRDAEGDAGESKTEKNPCVEGPIKEEGVAADGVEGIDRGAPGGESDGGDGVVVGVLKEDVELHGPGIEADPEDDPRDADGDAEQGCGGCERGQPGPEPHQDGGHEDGDDGIEDVVLIRDEALKAQEDHEEEKRRNERQGRRLEHVSPETTQGRGIGDAKLRDFGRAL
jgi:hypothetical protein